MLIAKDRKRLNEILKYVTADQDRSNCNVTLSICDLLIANGGIGIVLIESSLLSLIVIFKKTYKNTIFRRFIKVEIDRYDNTTTDTNAVHTSVSILSSCREKSVPLIYFILLCIQYVPSNETKGGFVKYTRESYKGFI